jgi:hypothetical protein
VAFFQRVLELARADRLLSDEHFSVDGTLAVMPEGVEHARNPGEWYEEERVPTAVIPKGVAPDGHVLPAPVSQLGAAIVRPWTPQSPLPSRAEAPGRDSGTHLAPTGSSASVAGP